MAIDPMELVKNQNTDALLWAKSFMATLEVKKIEVDEALMLSWFSNVIMTKHDSIYWRRVKPLEDKVEALEKELKQYMNAWRFIND